MNALGTGVGRSPGECEPLSIELSGLVMESGATMINRQVTEEQVLGLLIVGLASDAKRLLRELASRLEAIQFVEDRGEMTQRFAFKAPVTDRAVKDECFLGKLLSIAELAGIFVDEAQTEQA